MERLEPSLNVHALELPRLMLSLSLEQDCVCAFQSKRSVHVWLCRLNADVSINVDHVGVLSTDMPVITTQFQLDVRPHGNMDRWTRSQAFARAHLTSSTCRGKELERGRSQGDFAIT